MEIHIHVFPDFRIKTRLRARPIQSPKITVDWKKIKLTPPKSNVELHHASTDKSNHDHLIKMHAFDKHPSEHRHKKVE